MLSEKLNFKNFEIYKKVRDLVYRFSPSMLLLGLTTLLSGKNGVNSNLVFECLIIYPVLMPIVRMGMPLKILDKSSEIQQANMKSWLLLYLILSFFSTLIYLIISVEYLFFISLSIIGAAFYNWGTVDIRNGQGYGYLKYNSPVYILMLLYLFYGDLVLIITSILILFCFITLILGGPLKLDLSFTFPRWLNDCLGATVLPFAIFSLVSTLDFMGPNEYMVIKLSAILSSSMSALLLLKVSTLSIEELSPRFFKIKLSYLPTVLLLGLVLIMISIILVGVNYTRYIVLLILVEMIAFIFGQYNVLNILMGKQYAIMLSSFIVLIISAVIWLLLTKFSLGNTALFGFIIYSSILLSWQFISRLLFRYV